MFLGFDKAPIDEALFSFMEYGIHNHEDIKFWRQICGSLRTTKASNFITKIINNETEMPSLWNFMLRQCQNKEPHQVFKERQKEELETILKYGDTSDTPGLG